MSDADVETILKKQLDSPIYRDLEIEKKVLYEICDTKFVIIKFTTGLVEIFCCAKDFSYVWSDGELVVFNLAGEDWVIFNKVLKRNRIEVYYVDAWNCSEKDLRIFIHPILFA